MFYEMSLPYLLLLLDWLSPLSSSSGILLIWRSSQQIQVDVEEWARANITMIPYHFNVKNLKNDLSYAVIILVCHVKTMYRLDSGVFWYKDAWDNLSPSQLINWNELVFAFFCPIDLTFCALTSKVRSLGLVKMRNFYVDIKTNRSKYRICNIGFRRLMVTPEE